MGPLVNVLSWSLSRQQAFNECRRQYYWQYYGSWGGWDDSAPPEARQAYRLKQIVNLDMWAGDILHTVVEGEVKRLRSGYRPKPVPLRERTRALLNEQWKQSVEQRWRDNAKHNRNLFEHYYGLPVSDARRMEIRDKLFACLEHFCSLPLLDHLMTTDPAAWLAIEHLDTFLADGVPVYVKMDCAVRLNGKVTIIDWKSGKESERDRDQVACYGLYAMQKWRSGLESVGAVLVYLHTPEVVETTIAPETALAMQEKIVTGIHAMRQCLVNPAANEARRDDFPMTDQKNRCRRCNFHEMCYGPGPIVEHE
ncbi:MAG: PD-(D/E)XK nuclease family protein [Candidatus Sumerlaeia bacterium]|nr:PD-(D/E)XK nuclease family protein [Candidatus Sumerlaeia bacterium]